MKLNPIQRIALNGVLSSYEAGHQQLKAVKDIHDKLQFKEALELVDQKENAVIVKSDIQEEQLYMEFSLSRAEKELLLSILTTKKFTLFDYDWVIPILDYLKN